MFYTYPILTNLDINVVFFIYINVAAVWTIALLTPNLSGTW